MNQSGRASTWLLLGVLGCLFVLGAMLPRSWRQAADGPGIQQALDNEAARPAATQRPIVVRPHEPTGMRAVADAQSPPDSPGVADVQEPLGPLASDARVPPGPFPAVPAGKVAGPPTAPPSDLPAGPAIPDLAGPTLTLPERPSPPHEEIAVPAPAEQLCPPAIDPPGASDPLAVPPALEGPASGEDPALPRDLPAIEPALPLAAPGPPATPSYDDSPAGEDAGDGSAGPTSPATEMPPATKAAPDADAAADDGRDVPLMASLPTKRNPPAAMEPTSPEPDDGSDEAGWAGDSDDATWLPDGDGPLPSPAWPEPAALVDHLARLESEAATAAWAAAVREQLARLAEVLSARPAEAAGPLARLEELAGQASLLSYRLEDRELARQLTRAGYALRRRLDIWQQIAGMSVRGPAPLRTAAVDARQLSGCLAAIDAAAGEGEVGRAWRAYLMLEALEALADGRTAPPAGSSPVAREALRRLAETPMTTRQREFISGRPFESLAAALRYLAAEPIEPARLLADLERYEQSRLPSNARLLAGDCRDLVYSAGAERIRLGRWVDAHYRNANVRVSLTADLLNRLMPRRDPEYMTVRDTVLGHPVRGRSLTSAEATVRLLPDPDRVRLALEITGQVASLTSSTAGPATFYSDSNARYLARKPLEIDLDGIRAGATRVYVYNDTRLRDLETDFDGIPLFGTLAKEVARSQHDWNLPAANREVRQKMAARARQRIDAETGEQLAAATERLKRQILEPMHNLSLDPTMVDAQTDERRFTMRLRLAGEDQLGAHNPRPRAPSDSLASLQIHETAVNNALERLELGGRTFTLRELSEHVAERLNRLEPWDSNPEHDDVTITFTQQNPIHVRFEDGKMALTLAVAELRKPPRVWRAFKVRAFYVPVVDGLSAELSREGIIQLIGTRLTTTSQIILRGVFTRTFSRKRPWNLTPERLLTAPELADVEITQLTIEDGWIGAALGPQRTAALPAPAAR